MPDNATVSLADTIEQRLKEFSIEPSMISERLNFAALTQGISPSR